MNTWKKSKRYGEGLSFHFFLVHLYMSLLNLLGSNLCGKKLFCKTVFKNNELEFEKQFFSLILGEGIVNL